VTYPCALGPWAFNGNEKCCSLAPKRKETVESNTQTLPVLRPAESNNLDQAAHREGIRRCCFEILLELPLDCLGDALECIEQCSLTPRNQNQNANTIGVMTMTGVFFGMTRATMMNRNVEFVVVQRKKGKSISPHRHQPPSFMMTSPFLSIADDLCTSPVNAKGPLA
jgi:hypothetical protein